MAGLVSFFAACASLRMQVRGVGSGGEWAGLLDGWGFVGMGIGRRVD